MYCPKCGTEQTGGGKFCHKCGYKFANENGEQSNTDIKEIHNNMGNNTISNQKNNSKLKDKKVLLGIIIAGSIVIAASFLILLYGYTIKKHISNPKPTISKENQGIEDKLRSAIDLNLEAMEEEDLDKYMSTISIPSDEISSTEETLKKYFRNYDLKYAIEDFQVLTTDNDDAQVQVVQTTKKIQGLDFRDNRVTAIHHLKLINGQWKIFKTDTKNIEYINEQSNAQAQQGPTKNASLNQEQAVAIMQKIMPNGSFWYDHDETKGGVEYYVIRQVGKGTGTSPTVGWFYVGKKDGVAFKCNLADNTLIEIDTNK